MNSKNSNRSFGIIPSLVLFGLASLILFAETNYLIPYLSKISGTETVIWWFLVAAFGMFIPLLFIASYILRKEGWLLKPGMW